MPDMRSAEERERAERYRDVPLVVAPGQEEAYLQDKARREAAEDGEQHRETGGKEEVWKEGTGEKEGKEEEKDDALREGTAFPGSRRGKSATERRSYRRRATRTDGKACSARWGWTAWAM